MRENYTVTCHEIVGKYHCAAVSNSQNANAILTDYLINIDNKLP